MLHYRAEAHAVDDKLAVWRVLVLEQIGLCYSLCSTTWPFSKTWIKSFDTSTLAVLTTSGSAGGGTAASNAVGSRNRIKLEAVRLRPDKTTQTTSVYRRESEGQPRESFGSQDMIIRREDTFVVTYDQSSLARGHAS